VIAFLTRHEWKLLATNDVVRIVIAVFGAALVFASLLGVARARAEDTAAIPAPRSMRADAIANERGAMLVMPAAPMASLAAGQSDVYPGYLKVTARNVDALVTGDQVAHPLAVASGHFDVAFVILFLYPLLVFAISFDLTAGERDRGTLRMVLAQPVGLRDVVAGKVIARAVLLGVPVIIIPILAASNAAPPLLAAWTAAVVAYGLIWHGIALIVNARGWNAATNALVLAGIWLLFAIVGPATINLIIDLRYPMPSRVTAAVQARAATQEATVQGNRELGQFLQDHPTSSNVGREGMRQFAMLQAARDRQIAERLQAVETAFEQQLQRQQRLASWLSVLSPTMVAQGVLLETAGTGRTRFEHFNAAASRFQAEWKAYFEPRVLDAATLTADEVRDAPKFNYVDDTSVTGQVAVPIAGMAIAGAALVWLGFRSYRGYQL
jgi:ABC-2 type transport system permease protein